MVQGWAWFGGQDGGFRDGRADEAVGDLPDDEEASRDQPRWSCRRGRRR
ncbi:MAG: hypothetical protein R3B46_10215 [Phycisphaerales bacterium]